MSVGAGSGRWIYFFFAVRLQYLPSTAPEWPLRTIVDAPRQRVLRDGALVDGGVGALVEGGSVGALVGSYWHCLRHLTMFGHCLKCGSERGRGSVHGDNPLQHVSGVFPAYKSPPSPLHGLVGGGVGFAWDRPSDL